MKVLRSAKPYWIYLWIIGKKRVEVSKNFPISPNWDKTVEMYCSKDMKSFNRIPKKDREWMCQYLGKIAFKFVCDYITKARADTPAQAYAHNNPHETCMSDLELCEYATIGKPLYFLHGSEITIYDEPKELSVFLHICPPKDCDLCKYFTTNGILGICDARLTRPPQSWCYVS